MKKILVLNGSPQGKVGNCAKWIREIQRQAPKNLRIKVVHLAEKKSLRATLGLFGDVDGVIFVTGTYWDSWGSPLQKLFEEMTELEGSAVLLGKPCAVFVLMHSVGGKGILSRLQGVLSTMGFLIPPMSGMVYSLASDLAMKNSKSAHQDDFWEKDDISRILYNFLLSLEIQVPWRSWPVDRKNFRKSWL
jgi:NAD(P)H-dependent FMN reductase